MKVAIFCHPTCSSAIKTLHYFRQQGFHVSLVVIETAIRQKFSASEQRHTDAHDEFNRILSQSDASKQNGHTRLIHSLWLGIPSRWRSFAKLLLPSSILINNSVVGREARELNIPVVMVDKHSSEATKNVLEKHAITHVLLASSNWLIKQPLLSMENTNIINAHCARLPRHRSLDSLPWSVVENDSIGLTTHYVDAGIDTGPILLFLEVPPQPGDNLNILRSRINEKVPEIFLKSMVGLRDGTITPVPQKLSDGIHHYPMSIDQLLEAEKILQTRISEQAKGNPAKTGKVLQTDVPVGIN